MAAFLVMLREGVEAALIVAILLAYLYRMGAVRHVRWVWAGTLAASAVSIVAGVFVYNTIGSLDGRAEELMEGFVALAAAALLSWMIIWMGRNARVIKSRLESDAAGAVAGGGATALTAVAFVAVLREGLESALFMISTTVGTEVNGTQFIGGIAGLAAAVVIGYLVYRGGSRLDLRLFFRLTGFLIILFAAGLIAKGIHEFQEAGVLVVLNEHVWQLGVLDPDTTTIGRFAKTMFGWSPAPSLLMVIGYLAFLVPVTVTFARMTAKVDARRSPKPQPIGP